MHLEIGRSADSHAFEQSQIVKKVYDRFECVTGLDKFKRSPKRSVKEGAKPHLHQRSIKVGCQRPPLKFTPDGPALIGG